MYSFLYSEELEKRYDTVLKEISIASPSFFDAYLDMMESTIKFILRENKIKFDRKSTCGYLIREPAAHSLFEDDLCCSSFGCSTDSLKDCIRECNNHKHDEAHDLDFEVMINLLQVYFNLLYCYSLHTKRETVSLDIEFFYDLYGKTHRNNEEWKEKFSKQKEEFEEKQRYLEEQNRLFKEQLAVYNSQKQRQTTTQSSNADREMLIDLLTKSEKFDLCWSPVKDWISRKRLYLTNLILILVFGLMATILSSCSFGMYSTFSFIENIWMAVSLVVLLRTLKIGKVVPNESYRKLSINKFSKDHVGYYADLLTTKTWFKAFHILGIFAPLLNICYLFITDGSFKGIVITLELIVFVLSILVTFSSVNFHHMYSQFVMFKGKSNRTDRPVTLVGSTIDHKIMTYQDFVKKFGGIDVEILSS